jgi:hypothetical protein
LRRGFPRWKKKWKRRVLEQERGVVFFSVQEEECGCRRQREGYRPERIGDVELYIVVEQEVSESNTQTNERTSMIEQSALVVQLCNVRVRAGSHLVICYT